MNDKENLQKQGEELVTKLSLIKDDYINTKEELKMSIRIDVILAQLKDILVNSVDFDSLKTSLENIISDLKNILNLNIKEDKENESDK